MKNINKMYLIIIVLVILLIGLLMYSQINKSSKVTSASDDKIMDEMDEAKVDVQTQNTSTPEPISVPFDYTITSVSDDTILMDGEKGEMMLPNDPSVVTVFFRENGVETPATLSDVQTEMKANLLLDPGKSATLYLIK